MNLSFFMKSSVLLNKFTKTSPYPQTTILLEKSLILMKNHKIINKNIKVVNLEILKVKTWFGDKDL